MPLHILLTPPCSVPTALALIAHTRARARYPHPRTRYPPPSRSLPAAPVLDVHRPSPLRSPPADLALVACRPRGSLPATLALATHTVMLAGCRPYAHCRPPPAFAARCPLPLRSLPAALALVACTLALITRPPAPPFMSTIPDSYVLDGRLPHA
ncbi:hypothetical protein B0H14DRAFT_3500437 [Mycena olivaceomarginata]|nr:hypothetical protein B0H14DRAFT_3500437 [Mycena olivaceomarginata]